MRARGWALVAGALLITGCGGGSLEADDPNGYEACQRYAEADEITDDPLLRMGKVFDAGESASQAKTESIKAAAEPVADTHVVDGEALAAACEDAGF